MILNNARQTLKNIIMETNDLGSKKINNEQERNEGFSAENLPEDYNPKPAKMKADLETDQEGNHTFVKRATYNDAQTDSNTESLNHSSNPDGQPKVEEHKDRNSDVATNRYPNAHPDNHKDRGNIKLDE